MKSLAAALIKAQSEMAPLIKATKGNFGKYATLADVQDTCLEALGNHGIAVFQAVRTERDDEGRLCVVVSCKLVHAGSGEEWDSGELSLMPTKPDPQGAGSAITYGRRYALMAAAGIAPEDDDGTEASKPAQAKPYVKPAPSHTQAQAKPVVQEIVHRNIATDAHAQLDAMLDEAAGEELDFNTIPGAVTDAQKIQALGVAYYGGEQAWAMKAKGQAGYASGRRTTSIAELTKTEAAFLLGGLEKKVREEYCIKADELFKAQIEQPDVDPDSLNGLALAHAYTQLCKLGEKVAA